MRRPDAYPCPGCGNAIAMPERLDEPHGWLFPEAWCTECGGTAERFRPLRYGPRWYAAVAEAFDKVSTMSLVLEPDTVEPLYNQASDGALACVMEPMDESPEAIEQEAAERTALAIAILAYGPGFVNYAFPAPEIEVDKKSPGPRRAVDLVREAYFHDPHVRDADYGRMVEEAEQEDQQREWAAEVDPDFQPDVEAYRRETE